MAHKASNGFIAPKPDGCDFTVTEHKRGGKEVDHEPSGIFVHGDERVGIAMNYSGIPSAWSTFALPEDPEFLREVAQAINMMADHIEAERKRRGHG